MSDVAKTERLVIITAGLLFLAVVVSILIDKISEKNLDRTAIEQGYEQVVENGVTLWKKRS